MITYYRLCSPTYLDGSGPSGHWDRTKNEERPASLFGADYNWAILSSYRRSWSNPGERLWHLAGGELEQIQFFQRHVSLWDTVNDHIGIEPTVGDN
jgi:hypothetical protein